MCKDLIVAALQLRDLAAIAHRNLTVYVVRECVYKKQQEKSVTKVANSSTSCLKTT